MASYEYEMVICIVNAGFSDEVMEAVREAGARGGTVIHGHGTANKESEAFFGIQIEPDKDVVMIVVKTGIRDAVLKAAYDAVGMNTAGQGVIFSLPVESAVGLKD